MSRHWLLIGLVGIIILLAGGGIIYKIKSSIPSVPKTVPQITITEPTIKITDPQRGNKNAPLTIVYYSDFACDSCAGADPILEALEKEFPEKIRFVWKDFPIHKNAFPESVEIHKAARCAATLGKFWDFQRIAFMHTPELRLNSPVLEKIISETGLDSQTMRTCMKSPGISGIIDDNELEARQLGVAATPTFFLNNIRYEGIMPYYQFAGTIRKILAQIEYENK
jgi:protein-disulfide isomerase